MTSIPPGLILVVGGLLLPLVPLRVRRALTILLPALVLVQLYEMHALYHGGAEATLDLATLRFWGIELSLLEVDALSLVFGWVFAITTLIWAVYAWHHTQAKESSAAFVYGGSALGVVFAGDLLTLFLFWEVMALASTLVILASGTARARSAAMRYLMVHLTGGVLLLAGIALRHASADVAAPLAFGPIGLGGPGSWLIFLGFAVNAAVPPLSAWLPDSYPEASPTGAVFLSAFTTKTAVYVLATAFAGEDLLIVMGAFMALYGIFYALNENDARRVLSYSIINQVGFMVCGIGLARGEWRELALNGVAAHAFCHILYKALLFMSAGAVLYRTGRTKCTELGGLWRTMPWTFAFGLVGALAISGLPLTSGFVSKPMIVQAAANGATGSALMLGAYLVLMVASAGVSLHAGIKFPWFVFLAKDSGLRPKEAPRHMLFAMGLAALGCIGLGLYPKPLYDMLPGSLSAAPFVAYTADHVILQLEILVASGFAFFLLLPVLQRTDTITLDTDWFYRRGARASLRFVDGPLMAFFGGLGRIVHESLPKGLGYLSRNPAGAVRLGFERLRLAAAGLAGSTQALDRAQARFERQRRRYDETKPTATWPIGLIVLYATLALLIYLVAYLAG